MGFGDGEVDNESTPLPSFQTPSQTILQTTVFSLAMLS